MSIQKLSQDVVNQISAGEVVERPAHLVKELVENSIDAKSTLIHVEVAAGGRFIRVMDDGSGIKKEELELALTRHATSKISKTDDLWALNTFGFRGEALASAAAVSQLTLISKHKDSKEAYQMHSKFGVFTEADPANRNAGTEIKIEALFENVPARLKFLKSDAAEFSQIKNVIKAMALANPHIEFKLINAGKLELFYGRKLEHIDRIGEVLENPKMFENQSSRESYVTKAFFSSPQDVYKTSKNIWIFAQGRWIQDRGLQAAVMEAHRSLLMHGEYPICAIFLNCDPENIDVNIHPTKSQVKFQDANLAFRSVQAGLRDGLEKAPWIVKTDATPVTDYKNTFTPSFREEKVENLFFADPGITQTVQKKKTFDISTLNQIHTPQAFTQPAPAPVFMSQTYWSQFDVIGQVNQTYIVCQKDDKMILVDQHAAHERVAYEKLMNRWKQSHAGNDYDAKMDVQDFLFPLAIDLSVEKIEALMTVQTEMRNMGIDFEMMGPQVIGVKSSPTFIKDSVYPFVLEKMSQELLDHGGSHRLEKIIGDIFATMACHSVVRAGQSLSKEEMKQLLVEMDQFPLSSFCPHGRPVSVEFGFNEIEKKFGRIN
jgi:DNA mismatch repair protein MutL